ncbi:hypothetical protein BD289DRAFT_64188 [Coniella lustricola]|uniref:Uncharacterized protein n=1 Tax=Coniella lustricola TaxID=2025994 RepID=A0A2T3A0A8_9PEZI|nr:hypothetical protein BD289DRAFT_64188 [Coniella lustricola]
MALSTWIPDLHQSLSSSRRIPLYVQECDCSTCSSTYRGWCWPSQVCQARTPGSARSRALQKGQFPVLTGRRSLKEPIASIALVKHPSPSHGAKRKRSDPILLFYPRRSILFQLGAFFRFLDPKCLVSAQYILGIQRVFETRYPTHSLNFSSSISQST